MSSVFEHHYRSIYPGCGIIAAIHGLVLLVFLAPWHTPDRTRWSANLARIEVRSRVTSTSSRSIAASKSKLNCDWPTIDSEINYDFYSPKYRAFVNRADLPIGTGSCQCADFLTHRYVWSRAADRLNLKLRWFDWHCTDLAKLMRLCPDIPPLEEWPQIDRGRLLIPCQSPLVRVCHKWGRCCHLEQI